MPKLLRAPLFGLVIAAMYFTTYAFASTQTNRLPQGGEAASLISGWNVTNVHYTLADGSAKISAVEFDLDSAAGFAKVSLSASSSTYYTCINTNETHWACEIQPLFPLSEATELRVLAVGK